MANAELKQMRAALKNHGWTVGNAIAKMALLIRDHKHLENILSGQDGKTRQEIYDAVRPHLRFTPWPLDSYVAAMGRTAEAKQLPIQNPDGTLREFSPAQDVRTVQKSAEDAIARDLAKRTLTMVCVKCLRQEQFFGIGTETPVTVILKAREQGWVFNPANETETCPQCR
jgi:hypothetical protein